MGPRTPGPSREVLRPEAGSRIFRDSAGARGLGNVPNPASGRAYPGGRRSTGRLFRLVAGASHSEMIYQLGWTTLPGLGGLSVSEFRAIPTEAPDNERG